MLTATKMTPPCVKLSLSLQAKLENRERMLDALINNLDGMVYCSLYDARRSLVFVGGIAIS